MQQILKTAIRAALEAGKAILEVYHSEEFDVEMKGDNSPLTKADKASHNIIMSFLSKTNIPVLSEEGKSIPYEERKDWKLLWIIDPVDGTKEFIKRNGEFTVNIALIENQKPLIGVTFAFGKFGVPLGFLWGSFGVIFGVPLGFLWAFGVPLGPPDSWALMALVRRVILPFLRL